MVWNSIPMQLAKENKKFFFGQIKKGARSSEFEIAIQWLLDCGLIYKVPRVNEPHMPLKAYQSMNAYKLFMLLLGHIQVHVTAAMIWITNMGNITRSVPKQKKVFRNI